MVTPTIINQLSLRTEAGSLSDRNAPGVGFTSFRPLEARQSLIARGGRDSRFSPDGRWIAYWHETMMAAPFAASAGTVDVVASAGGTPRRVAPDLTEAGVPVWSDDSKHLMVFGRKDELSPPVADWNGGSSQSK